MSKSKEAVSTATFMSVRDFIEKAQGDVKFASNYFGTSLEATSFLTDKTGKVEKLGGKTFVELHRGGFYSTEHYSDTLIIWLPYLGRLPSLINHTEKEYMALVMGMGGDELDIIDPKDYVISPYAKYSNPEVIMEPGIVIRAWWD